MLDILFSKTLSKETKKDMPEEQCRMAMNENIEGGMNTMIGLGQSLWDEAMEAGLEEGRREGRREGREELREEINEAHEQTRVARERGVFAVINTAREFNASDDDIVRRLIKEFSLGESQARQYLKKQTRSA